MKTVNTTPGVAQPTNIQRDETADTEGKIQATRENFTAMRNFECDNNWLRGNYLYTELEKTYGKYLYMPYDVPVIKPNDMEYFIKWYDERADHARKVRGDFASKAWDEAKQKNTSYRTVDSTSPDWSPMWSLNSHAEIYTEFPELFEQIHEYMPWVGPQDFRWNMWSSSYAILPHRDNSSFIDLPHAMRIKIYDENPKETLSLCIDPKSPTNRVRKQEWKYLALPEETNTFGWNNLRTLHRSKKRPDCKKILMIWRDRFLSEDQVNSFVDLMDRSVSKWQGTEYVWEDTEHNANDFLIVEE
jgi:hypothetical protein